MGYSVKVVIDKRYLKTDGRYPIKIKVYLNGAKVRYSTDYSLTEEDWNKMYDINTKDKSLVRIKKKLEGLKKDAENVLDDPEIRNHLAFEKEFFKEVHRSNYKLSFWFQEYINELVQHKRAQSTIINYQTALRSIESFYPNPTFQDVTPDFLKKYESWMKGRSRSKATLGIYLRNLRCIFNYVIYDKNIIKEDIYPFGRNKYIIKTKSKKKQSLTFEQVKQIGSLDCSANGSLDFARDMWIFHYLLNGSNTKDICRLRFSDLDLANKTFSFYRAKTEDTETEVTPISGVLHDRTIHIIEKWGNRNRNGFVFPFFNEFNNQNEIDPKRERTIIAFVRRRINRNLLKIEDQLDLPIKLTTGIARHSFARRLSSNFNIQDISDQLGHQSTKTTENYINSIDFKKKQQMSDSLL